VIARRLAARFFGVALTKQGRRLVASAEHTVSADGTPDGSSCKFYASAVAGILAAFTDFDGALLHETCAARGDGACRWYTSTS
jgi:predicted hydrocarbon binding protein